MIHLVDKSFKKKHYYNVVCSMDCHPDVRTSFSMRRRENSHVNEDFLYQAMFGKQSRGYKQADLWLPHDFCIENSMKTFVRSRLLRLGDLSSLYHF